MRPREISGTRRVPLCDGWELSSREGAVLGGPLGEMPEEWRSVRLPASVLSLVADGWQDAANVARDLEQRDWLFRLALPEDLGDWPGEVVLRLGRLTPLADVYLDDELVLTSCNAFIEHEVRGQRLAGRVLTIVCRSLTHALRGRRAPPRWRAPIVDNQRLRWFRAPLFGHMPGWTPPCSPVGILSPPMLEQRRVLDAEKVVLNPRVADRGGELDFQLQLRLISPAKWREIWLQVGAARHAVGARFVSSERCVIEGTIPVPDAGLWWPHTHGPSTLHDCRLRIEADGLVDIDLGRIGFRNLSVDEGPGFGLRVNGQSVFCRGACWTPVDAWRMVSEPRELRSIVARARAAGMNMLRVSGATTYEAEDFFDICDDQGVLVWQDFMFSSMDYPTTDPAFVEQAMIEVDQLTAQWNGHASLAVACGNSEVEQSAAMLGRDRAEWHSDFYYEVLAKACQRALPGVIYRPGTPIGGPLPFSSAEGTAHAYAIGNYMRPSSEARLDEPVFATECLGFANLPGDGLLESLLQGEAPFHHPRWKTRVPRDRGAGHDFDDVRDHYFRELYRLDPMSVRRTDCRRYVELSRAVSGMVMARVLSEWRRTNARCRGALVWNLKDLWPGPGWGVLNADGSPKAAYYQLRRVLTTPALVLTDEGCDGLWAHLLNEGSVRLDCRIEVTLWRSGEVCVEKGVVECSSEPRSAQAIALSTAFRSFVDLSYAYRFGPPGHDAVSVSLVDAATGRVLSDCLYFCAGRPVEKELDVGLEASLSRRDSSVSELSIRTRRLAQIVEIECEGAEIEDNYFDLAPTAERVIVLRGQGPRLLRGSVRALNAHKIARFGEGGRDAVA